jgi:23S rRNA (guanine2445-N2)-methyltransferase / 23S rRNA (guanine2069-N7)-methyltransferase
MNCMTNFFATCPKGLESVLASELSSFQATDIKETIAGVSFTGDLSIAYRACLWSRFASRIALNLATFDVDTDLDLYLGCFNVPWETHFNVDQSFSVDFTGSSNEIRNTQYGALKVKDAIVDRFSKRQGIRPSVDKRDAEIRIMVHLKKDTANVSLDLSGPALHQRGYRLEAGEAPLKENLAAAIVARSGWTHDKPFFDPMCGSGTLVIEAAMMAARFAPGLLRKKYGFQGWLQHDAPLWASLLAEAKETAKTGLEEARARGIQFLGYDIDPRVLDRATQNARRAGVDGFVRFESSDVMELESPWPGQTGYLVSNPPYGARLGEFPDLIKLYQNLGLSLRTKFQGWQVSVFSASPDLLSCLRLRADKQYRLFNGALECQLRNYLVAENAVASQKQVAEDFANRLRKNLKTLDKWAQQEGIEAYRIYDADLPDYNVAIDRYADQLVIQEYAPPKTIEEHVARQRLLDLMQATIDVTGVAGKNVVLKVRERQRGDSQYQRLNEVNHELVVREYNARFRVNLQDYLDTGLFLDHRYTRRMLQKLASGKDFLNLFAYTGSATVHAALGGAMTTTTVDMSRTYLNWARDNMELNGQTGRQHRYEQADCLEWLRQCRQNYDLIFIDPPTFSNSKRMEQTFDVQRDHVQLLTELKRLMRPDGLIVFSNNKRHFRMDLEQVAALGLVAQNISAQTLPKDFARNPHIHNCWVITDSAHPQTIKV